MAQLMYAMQFRGNAAPVEGAANVMKATTRAASGSIVNTIGENGLSSRIEGGGGGEASFESQVKVGEGGSFQEDGTITFGGGHTLRFTTVGQGQMGPSAQEGLTHGAVIWRIEGGEGQFRGATGLITSNFTVNGSGEVVDNQFGVIFVP